MLSPLAASQSLTSFSSLKNSSGSRAENSLSCVGIASSEVHGLLFGRTLAIPETVNDRASRQPAKRIGIHVATIEAVAAQCLVVAVERGAARTRVGAHTLSAMSWTAWNMRVAPRATHTLRAPSNLVQADYGSLDSKRLAAGIVATNDGHE